MPGYYKTKLVKGAPWVPARIWIERELDEDGEQLNEDHFRCIVNGVDVNPFDRWVWLCGYPISMQDYVKMRGNTSENVHEPVNLATMKPIF